MSLPNRELFVDTGINTGWSYFTGNVFPEVGCITCPVKKRKTLENYIRFMGIEFNLVLDEFRPTHITIEHPEVWQDSGKGKDAIQSGSLLHLAANAYAYAGICTSFGFSFTLVTARQWKGSLTKDATAYRVKKINGMVYENDHIADATAMGLSRDKDIWLLKKSGK